MSTTLTVVVAPVGVAVVNAGVFGTSGVIRYGQVRAYQAWAAEHRMQYARRDDSRLTRCAWGLPFGRSSGQRAIDVVTGIYRGRSAACFTDRYTTRRPGCAEAGGRQDRHYFGPFSGQLPHPVPELRVTKPLFGHRRPGLADVSATYQVLGADRAFAEQVRRPGMQRFLLTNELGGLSMVEDRIFIRTRRRVEPDRIEHCLDPLIAIIERTHEAAGLR